MLQNANLMVNKSKTEEYVIPCPTRNEILSEHSYSRNPGKEEWKKCKLLGSYLDSEIDIKHRRSLAINHMKNHRNIFKSKHRSIDLKVRYFNCFITSIFLYNCALWTLTETMIKSLDSFHRRLLRYAINLQYPKKISNVDLYKVTGEKPWSEIVKQRRKRLLGHICRLHPDTPARQALNECLKVCKKKVGRPKFTWIEQVKKDLLEINVAAEEDFSNIFEICADRDKWRRMIVNTTMNDLHHGGQPSERVRPNQEELSQVSR